MSDRRPHGTARIRSDGRVGSAHATAPDASASPRRVVGTLIVAVVGFAVQQTAVVPAVHDVQVDLHASPEWASWLVTVYLMVATAATPALGRLGDLYGRRRVLLAGLGVFAVASAAAAVAPNLPVLLACRAVQGVGGAVYPLALALARSATAGRTTGAVSALGAAFGIGTALGFVGGGLLAQHVSWRAVFAAGAVLVAVGWALSLRLLPATRERAGGGYDLIGTGLLALASIALLGALTLVITLGATAAGTIGVFVLAVLAAAGWVWRERSVGNPLVDLHILRRRPVTVANLAAIGLGWALFGSYLVIPQLARTDPHGAGYGLGLDSAAIGLLMLPIAVGQTFAAPIAGVLERRIPARLVSAAGLLLLALSAVLLALDRSSVPLTLVASLVLGVGAGAGLQASSAVVTAGVPADVAAASTALNSTVRRLAGGAGGQVGTIVLAAFAGSAAATPTFTGYLVVYLIEVVLCVAGAAVVAVFGRGPGQ
ncbi:membrane transport protein [Actinocatenispora thailandica]|uniref:Membrane transport protein n=1 Tax=Actinocatenispora thailandica TaxID=227318 RepID=A0A7R7DLW9_9ACTN|nr:MFS transporter [Actinocatenispora thailandica]BCJ34124.1 membrane transport protein [Actinocatenispora thailandica]